MRHLRLHFLLGYAAAGAIAPFFPEFLRTDRGFDAKQIGVIFAAPQLCIMIAPVVLTLLADRMVSPRPIAAFIFGLAFVTACGLWFVSGFWATLLLFMAWGFSFAAIMPSMDGLYFALQQKRNATGEKTPPYHRIRLLGTIGFILPSVILLALVPASGSLVAILPTAAALSFVALLNAFALPDPRAGERLDRSRARMPTLDAARALFSRPNLAFCAGMALIQVAHAAYYAFYPVYLVESLHVEARWLGTVSNVGVATEAVLLLGFGWMSVRLGARNMLMLGALLTGLRLVLVAEAPGPWLAIAANLLHGPIVLFTFVAPVLFINGLAGDAFRNSIQGVYVVAVIGPARIAGNLLCGWLAAIDTRFAFAAGALLAMVSAALFLVLVRNASARSPTQ